MMTTISKRLARMVFAIPIAAPLAALAAMPVLAGPLQGVNGHVASGSAEIGSGEVTLGPDFRFDGGPDVYVALRGGGRILLLGRLRANAGAQAYALPSGEDGAGAEEILLYCKQYNVVLGKAPAN